MRVIAFFILILLVSACSGTLQDISSDSGLNKDFNKPQHSYEGIANLVPTAHNELRVSFPAAEKLPDQEVNYRYRIYVSGLEGAIELDESTAFFQDGLYHYTIKGLDKDIPYTVSVRAVLNSIEDGNDESISLYPMPTEVPEFDGIDSCEPMPGYKGLTQVLCRWRPAISSTILGAVEETENFYIFYGDSKQSLEAARSQTPENVVPFNSGSLCNPGVEMCQAVITGLEPGIKYYFGINAQNNFGGVKRIEKNIEYRTAKTLSALEGIEFDGVKSLALESGIQGLNTIKVKWDKGRGNFDRYRILVWYHEGDDFDFPQEGEFIVPNRAASKFTTANGSTSNYFIYKDVTALELTETTISIRSYLGQEYQGLVSNNTAPSNTIGNILAYKNYYISVVACEDDLCNPGASAGVDKWLPIKTQPKLATFYGIEPIAQLDDDSQLLSGNKAVINLDWETPSNETGISSHIQIFLVDPTKDVGLPTAKRVRDDIHSGDQLLNPYEISSLTSGVALGQVSGNSIVQEFYLENEYCFTARVVYRHIEGATSYTDPGVLSPVQCINPTITPANLTNYSCSDEDGLDNPAFEANIKITKPSEGIFSGYEVYLYDGSGTPNFDEAINHYDTTEQDTFGDHKRMYFGGEPPIVTFGGLLPERSYQFLVKALFKSSNGTSFRSANSYVINCSTGQVSGIQKGWHEITALGAKEDGLKDQIVNESFASFEYEAGQFTNYGSANYPLIEGRGSGIKNFPHAYPVTDDDLNDPNPPSYSNMGMIRLSWYDFEVDGQPLFERLKSISDNNVDIQGFGYKVLRSDTRGGTYSIVSGANLILPYKYILDDSTGHSEYLADFVDYIGVEDDIPTLKEHVGKARRYFYKVILCNESPGKPPCVDGINVTTFEVEADKVIPVILPPKNMTLVHPWIANRVICSEMGYSMDNGSIQRSQGYVCDFYGMGYTLGTLGEKYYDFENYALIDRFELGCNISHNYIGLGPSMDNDGDIHGDAVDLRCYSEGPGDYVNQTSVSTKYCMEAGSGTSALNAYVEPRPSSSTEGVPGQIFYQRRLSSSSSVAGSGSELRYMGCYINGIDNDGGNDIFASYHQALLDHFADPGAIPRGGYTSAPQSIKTYLGPMAGDNDFINGYAGGYISNKWGSISKLTKAQLSYEIVSGQLTGTKKLSEIITSNDANLPPLSGITMTNAIEICRNTSIDYQKSETTEINIGKKLINRRVSNAAFAWSETLKNKINDLENGNGISSNVQYSCLTDSSAGFSNTPDLSLDAQIEKELYTTYPYYGVNNDAFSTIYKYPTGSARSQHCFSSFGLQDFIGSVPEWTSNACKFNTSGWCDMSTNVFTSNSTYSGIEKINYQSNSSGNNPDDNWKGYGFFDVSVGTDLVPNGTNYLGGEANGSRLNIVGNYYNPALGLPISKNVKVFADNDRPTDDFQFQTSEQNNVSGTPIYGDKFIVPTMNADNQDYLRIGDYLGLIVGGGNLKKGTSSVSTSHLGRFYGEFLPAPNVFKHGTNASPSDDKGITVETGGIRCMALIQAADVE